MYVSRYTIVGTLSQAPEAFFSGENRVYKFRVKAVRNYKTDTGWKSAPVYMDVEFRAELPLEKLQALVLDAPVYVDGELRQEHGERNGMPYSKYYLFASYLQPLGESGRAS